MKRIFKIVIVTLCCFVFETKSQEINARNSFTHQIEIDQSLLVHSNEENGLDRLKFDRLIKKLERKRSYQKNDITFLKSIFFKTHQKLLLEYNNLASLGETLGNGRYGCLSGTMIYALILEHFEFDYDILELPNHVFIQVRSDEKVVYFESTLPLDGFITDQKEIITSSISPEVDGVLEVVANESTTLWAKDQVINKIGLQELSALQHFNESIKKFNAESFELSIHHAVEAYSLYPSKRNLMLMQLILNKVRNFEGASEEVRADYLKVFKEELEQKGISQQVF